jgi:rhamnose transport system substrate-binding protein
VNRSKHELILGIFIAFELLFFSFTGHHFLSIYNGFECVRLGVEIGLLALALTPVIVTGGIDLSVGSMMGLCAVTFGAAVESLHWPIAAALAVVLLVSLLGGFLNAFLISRLRVSPLIVTLGTYSLFRGIAEGITGGAMNYSDFPPSFLFWGQGYWFDIVPPQTMLLVLAAVAYWMLLEKSVIGRVLYAVGHSYEGARYAGVPVKKRVALVYVLSGLAAGLASIVYVAHLGQAKSDSGNGYELTAITAVVLGGTSILGGSGTIVGTLLGLTAIVLLQNGIRLSGWPTESAGVATGVLLIVTLVLERITRRLQSEESGFSNRRLFLITGGGFALVAGFFLLRPSLALQHRRARRITIGVMPKAKGDPYFISCRAGAEQAAREQNVELLWDGPTGLDAAKQNEVVEGWITRDVDAISVAVENGPGISGVLRKARTRGIKVTTWDADAEPDARDYFLNQATPRDIGSTLADESARVMGGKGELAIITGALSAANQNLWISFIKKRLAEKYRDIKLVGVQPSDDDRDKAFTATQTLMKVYPALKILVVISAPAVPGAGEAVKQSGSKTVQVVGLSLPNLCKPYVHGGQVEAVVLWKTADLGYLAVTAPAALVRGTFPKDKAVFQAGRLGALKIQGTDIILGKPFIFRKDNIDHFDF